MADDRPDDGHRGPDDEDGMAKATRLVNLATQAAKTASDALASIPKSTPSHLMVDETPDGNPFRKKGCATDCARGWLGHAPTCLRGGKLPEDHLLFDGRILRKTAEHIWSGSTAPPNGHPNYLLSKWGGHVYAPKENHDGYAGSAMTEFQILEEHLADEPLVQEFPIFWDRPIIKFYRRSAPYGFLSNLFDAPCTVDDVAYPSSEHAYQAIKYLDPAIQAWILAGPKPRHVAQAAHLFTGPHESERPDWNDVKFHRMKACVRAKFQQNPDLKRQLLETGNAILIEAGETSDDVNGQANRTWGVAQDIQRGKNALGRMLMEVRGELGGTGSPLPDFVDEVAQYRVP